MKVPIALLVLAYLGFVSLGLPDAVQGISWPNVRNDFSLSQSSLGLILACGGLGYFLSSFFTGKLLRKLEIGKLLVISTGLVALGLTGYAVTHLWWLFLGCSFVIGTGSGAIDGALNAFASRHFSAKHMTWLHGCYGVGASLGPLLMTQAIANSSWRDGFTQLAMIMVLLTFAFTWKRRLWNMTSNAPADIAAPTEPSASLSEALKSKTVWLQMFTFFVYTGFEITVGQWSYTLNTEARGMSVQLAGSLTVLFWASLTFGRFVMGAIVQKFGAQRLLSYSFYGGVAGAILFVFAQTWTSALALLLIGVSLAAVYPLLMAETPQRVGDRLSDHAVGLQVSSATLGIVALPTLAGVLAGQFGLSAIAFFAVALSTVLMMLHLFSSSHRPSLNR